MGITSTQDIIAIRAKVIQGLLDVSGHQSWDDITMDDIVSASGVDVVDIMALFPNKMAIVEGAFRQIDATLRQSCIDNDIGNESLPVKDRLLDVFLERFDLLNEDRLSFVNIINGLTLKPNAMILLFSSVCQSMEMVLKLANIKNNGIKQSVMVCALCAVYLKTLRVWIHDETVDLSPTMAELDKNIDYWMKINMR